MELFWVPSLGHGFREHCYLEGIGAFRACLNFLATKQLALRWLVRNRDMESLCESFCNAIGDGHSRALWACAASMSEVSAFGA